MPQVTTEELPAYSWCIDNLCPGNLQAKVKGIRELHEYTVREVGSDVMDNSPFARIVDRSFYVWKFANEDDIVCPACGGPRQVDGQKRPHYPHRSGQRQDAFLLLQKHGSVEAGIAAEKRAEAEAAEAAAKDAKRALAAKKAARKAEAELKKLDKPEAPKTPEAA